VRLWPLLAIFLIGAMLRIDLLWVNAPPLYADELDQYVSIHHIVTTGVDTDGSLEPFLASRLERHPPIYGVTAYASTLIFGMTPLGWRLPAAIFGLISIGLVYLIAIELTRRRIIALTAALLMAIEPIQVHFSRVGWEPASAPPFLLGGLWLLLVALRNERAPLPFEWLAGGAVLIGLAPYTYAGTWFYAAILAGGLFVLKRSVFHDAGNRRKLLAGAAIALAVGGPGMLVAWTDPHTVDRAQQIATFGRGINGDSLGTFFSQYFSHFGWPYLFATGAGDPHYMSGYGALYWWYGPLIIAGLVYASRYTRSRSLFLWMLLWLFAYPLGGALTYDAAGAHPARTLAGSPILCIFGAIGAYALYHIGSLIAPVRWRRRYRFGLLAALTACMLASLWSFSTWYFRVYPVVTANAWESGAEEAFTAVRAQEAGYRRLCLIGFNYWHLGGLEGYYLAGNTLPIFEDGNSVECSERSTLMLNTHSTPPPGFTVERVIDGIDGKPFAMLETRPGHDLSR
jgi:4-amino-4-deoxy-L-arabinose transferase-like glycosyltransferase